MNTPNFILFHTAQYLELYDVAMCMPVFRQAQTMYQNVRHTEITYYSDVKKLVKKCPKISSLVIHVNLDPHEPEIENDTDFEEDGYINDYQDTSDLNQEAALTINRKYDIVEVLSILPITRLVCTDRISDYLVSQFKQLTYLRVPHAYTLDPELKLREIECESISGARSEHLEKLHLDIVDKSNIKKICSLTIKDVNGVGYLDKCPNLTSLNLLNEPINFDLRYMPFSLENLTLKNCDLASITSNAYRDLGNLKTLKLEGSKLDINLIVDLPIKFLSMKNVNIRNAGKLKRMRLIDLEILDCDINAKFVLIHLPNTLTSLHIKFEQAVSDEEMEILTKMETLTSLNIIRSNITGEVLPPNLKHLSLVSAKITEHGLNRISKLPLRSLTLVNCGLTDDTIAYLRPLDLMRLDIRKNYITAKGMTNIKFANYRYFKHDPVSIKHLITYLYS